MNNLQEIDAPTWTNPLVLQRADPHITLSADGYYYFTASVPEYDRIELRRATTLAGLAAAAPHVIWRKQAHGPMGAHIWAPELHSIDGKWYVYFAAGDAEDVWRIRPYVLANDSPNPLEGAWREKGQIVTTWDGFSLDATTFAHRGKHYLIWAQNLGDEPGTSLCLAQMDTPWSLTGPQVVITRPTFGWERIGHNVNEGAAVLQRNGRIFVTYSASATDANYCMGLLTADENADLLDANAWTKSSLPVFQSSHASSQYGPGHNCFTTTPDGKTDLLVYHARGCEKIDGEPLYNPDRATRVQPFAWHEDGTPDFGIPLPDGVVLLPGKEAR